MYVLGSMDGNIVLTRKAVYRDLDCEVVLQSIHQALFVHHSPERYINRDIGIHVYERDDRHLLRLPTGVE